MAPEDVIGVQNEIEFLSHIDHPNVVDLIDLFEDKDNFCMVLEVLPGGDLYEQLKGKHLPEKDIHRLIVPVFDAIFYCHDMGIVHRDLKPDNLLVSL